MGDGTSGDSQDPGFDLFDRWLAHREETSTPDGEAAAEATDAEPAEEPAPDEPAAEEPAPAAEGEIDPLFDESFPTDESEQTLEEPDLELPLDLVSPAPPAPPGDSEVSASAAPSPGTEPATVQPAERSRADLSNDVSRSILEALATPAPVERSPDPDAVTPTTFEPVIIPSARRKAEPRRGLLSGRRKKTEADPLDQPLDEPLVEPLVEAERPDEATDLVDPVAARQAELDRLAAEQVERQAELLRQTQAAEAARQAEADRLAAEEATRAAEAARQAELDRLAAEQAEREAELLRQTQAAEAARQAELDRLAAEQAERQAEADRLAAEEATRAAEAARQAELDRLAAEQAERQAELLRQTQAAEAAHQAEAERLAAEEATRAAEAARQAELDRLAAEQVERQAELLRQTQAAEAARQAELDRLAAAEAEQAPGPSAAPGVPDASGRADQVDAGREVFAAFAAAGAETEVPVSPPTEDEPEPRRHRRLGQRLTGGGASAPVPRPDARPAPRPAGLSQPDAVRALLAERAASGETRAEPATSRPAPQPARPGRDVAPVGESTNVDFTPRTGTRRLVNVLLLLALGGTAVAAYVAYEDRNEVNIGVAATLALLTLVIWAVRAGSDTARLSVRSGQLEVVRGGGRFVFDLTSRYTPIEVVGKPGKRGWKVLFLRRSMAPFVVDASMVDPEEFMRVLRRHRPEQD